MATSSCHIARPAWLSLNLLLFASVEVSEGFSIRQPLSPIDNTLGRKHGRSTVNSDTALSVMMGGSEPHIAHIPFEAFGYEDNILENVNDRTVALMEQYQSVVAKSSSLSGFDHILSNSQDTLAHLSPTFVSDSTVGTSTSFMHHDVIVGGSSTLLSSIPESVVDSIGGDSFMAMEQAAATITAAGGPLSDSLPQVAVDATPSSDPSLYSQYVDNAQSFTSPISPVADLPDINGAGSSVDGVSQLLADAVQQQQPALNGATTAASKASQVAGVDSSNKIMALLEKTVSSFDTLAAKSGDSLDDVARQLSDQLYQSFGSPETAQASLAGAPKYIAEKGDVVLQGALDEAERVFESSTSSLVEKGSQTLQAAKETPIKAILTNVIQVIEQILKVLVKTADGMLEGASGSTLSGHLAHFKTSLAEIVGQTTGSMTSALDNLGKVSIEQVAQVFLKELVLFIQVLSQVIMTLGDALLKTFTGDTLVGHIQHLQANVASVVTDTTTQLSTLVHDLGQLNMNEVAHLMLSLVTFIATIVFQLLNAFVVLLSGQGINELTLQAALAVKQELAQVASQVGDAAVSIAESSVSELGTLLLQLFENTSLLLAESAQALVESISVLLQTGGGLNGALASDTIQSVTDSVSMMTANL